MGIEEKKKKLELDRVIMAKKELEFRIEERLDEIEKLKEHVLAQDKRIKELEKEFLTK